MSDSAKKPLAQRENIEAYFGAFPSLPGVYLMKNSEDQVIYIGKAVRLRDRVRSYFRLSADPRPAVQLLRQKVHDIETVITQNEKAALLLENSLIKKHRPRYNIRLRDDKTFLGLRLTVNEPVPRLSSVRRPVKDRALYFGPFHSSGSMHQVRRLLQKLFGVRVCSDSFFRNRTRPCIEYQIGRCTGPCIAGLISTEDYGLAVENTRRFLSGETKETIKNLRQKMQESSLQHDYEAAMKARDLIKAIEDTLAEQPVVSHRSTSDIDALGLYRENHFGEFYVLYVRGGQVIGGKTYSLGMSAEEDDEVLASAILQHYSSPANRIPMEIVLPFALPEIAALMEAVQEEAKNRRLEGAEKLTLQVGQRGRKRQLTQMANENARVNFGRLQSHLEKTEKVMAELQKRLALPNLPRRIECFDISNFQGKEAVGSMVVFRGLEADKSAYRHFKIRSVSGINDFEMLKEVLVRRLKHSDEKPDLLIVDGGKGQLGMAQAALQELGVTDIPLAAMAKAKTLPNEKGRTEERIFLPGRMNPVIFSPRSPCLFLLQRLRDEAHRFAISHHRNLRQKASLHSLLDEISGIGPVKRRHLLKEFGSIARLRDATVEELETRGGLSSKVVAELKARL